MVATGDEDNDDGGGGRNSDDDDDDNGIGDTSCPPTPVVSASASVAFAHPGRLVKPREDWGEKDDEGEMVDGSDSPSFRATASA